MTIWTVKVRVRIRVMWVTIWYLTMNYLPNRGGGGVGVVIHVSLRVHFKFAIPKLTGSNRGKRNSHLESPSSRFDAV